MAKSKRTDAAAAEVATANLADSDLEGVAGGSTAEEKQAFLDEMRETNTNHSIPK